MFDTLLTSTEESKVFLKTQIRERTGLEFSWLCKNSRGGIRADALANKVSGYTHAGSLKFTIGYDPDATDQFTLSQLFIEGEFRHKGLMCAAVKAAIGMAYDEDVSVIYIKGIMRDGYSAWAAHGALPIDEPVGLADTIAKYRQTEERLTRRQDQILATIQDKAECNSYAALRQLSQTNIQISENKYGQNILLKAALFNPTYVLIPSDPATREILVPRIGPIPDCPPVPEEAYKLRRIIQLAADYG